MADAIGYYDTDRYDVIGVSTATPLPVTPAAGGAASGSPASGNPVLVAGSDGTNARTVATDTGGRLLPSGRVDYLDTAVALSASAGYYGTLRTPPAWARSFTVQGIADQTGTVQIHAHNGDGVWFVAATAAVAANLMSSISIVPCWPAVRAVMVNGATAQTFARLSSSFT